MKKSKSTEPQQIAMDVVNAYADTASKACDPQGSYTGRPKDKYEIPVQDADDL